MSYSVIDIKHVAKTYPGGVEALRSVTMDVNEGEIFGLLGPNGAGKSTLMKIMLTLVRPDECEGEILGFPIGHRGTLSKVGYLPEAARFPDYMTGRQVLDYIGGLHGVGWGKRRRKAAELVRLARMGVWADRPLSSYSKGMKQRLGLAQALINDPRVIFLDEPTDGLDPLGRIEVSEILRQLRREGKTVFINSHLLGEAERLCDRVAILAAGKVVKQGTVEDLTTEGGTYELRIEGPLPALPSVSDLVVALGGTLEYSPADGLTTITLSTSRSQLLQPVIDELRRFGITIESLMPRRRTLEQFFLETVGRRHSPLGDNGPATVVIPRSTLGISLGADAGDRHTRADRSRDTQF